MRPVGADNFKLFLRDDAGVVRQLLDPTTMTKDGVHFSLDWWEPSFDGKHLAYGLSQSGSEASVLHVMEVADGSVLPERIANTDAGVTGWLPDGSGFFYIMLTGERGTPTLYLNSEARLHKLRTDPAKDRTVLKAGMFADIAYEPVQVGYLTTNEDSAHVVAVVTDVRTEKAMWSAELADLLAGKPIWRRIAGFDDVVVSSASVGDALYLLTNRGAMRGRVVQTSLAAPDIVKAREVIAQSATVLESLEAARDGVFVTAMDGGIQRLSQLRNGVSTPVTLPFEGTVGGVFTSKAADGAYLVLTGWLHPSGVWRVGADGAVTDTGITPRPNIDTGPYETRRGFAAAKDGVKIPYTVISRKGSASSGPSPALVAAYGAYQFSSTPSFNPRILPFLDVGGVYVVANVRGGGEYGREWHKGGQKATKPNTWRDLIAVCEALIADKVTSREKLAITGTSAGGITVGRAMTERPDLFTAVISNVGWSNPLRYAAEQNISDIDEWGPIVDAASFRIMYDMDSYQAVKDGVRYPAVLAITGATDPRVAPWHVTKLAARLQAANVGDRPVLLRVDFDAGHGIGSTRSQSDALAADMYGFVLWQTGAKNFQPR
jgi:prolyl oligopeptidase